MRFDLFPNIKAKQGVPCTPEALAEAVDSDAYIQAVKELQAATDEEGERRAKNKLPVITFNASFDGRERKNANAIPSGLFFSDYDGIEFPQDVFNQKICGRCDELGILRVEVSIRQHGLHLITECRPGMKTIAENQRWLDEQLGLQCDKACKDLARATYAVPESFVLYERGRLWNGDPTAMVNGENQSIPHNSSPVTHNPSPITHNPSPIQSEFKGQKLTDIANEWLKQNGGMPVEGERNNVLHRLAYSLRYITDFRPEPIFHAIPHCGLADAEVMALCQSACNAPRSKRMPDDLRILLANQPTANSQQLTANDQQPTAEEDDDPHDEEFLQRLPPLPIGLKESLIGVPDKVKMPILCGIMPLAMTYATRVSVQYCDGKQMRLNGMSIIYGKQASGKSSVKDVLDVWMKPMMDADADARKREDEFKQMKKNRKANEKLPEEPHEPIFCVPVTISCSTLLKRMKNANGMHLFSFGEELDTLRKTNGAGSWSSKYDVYRLAFDNGVWGQDYNSDNAESGVVNVAYNWTVLGTLGAVGKCFKTDNVENGMGGRVLFSKMPSKMFEYMPTYKEVKPAHVEKINEAVQILASSNGFVDTPELRKMMKKWCNDKADEARESKDVVIDTFRKRAAVIGFRCGVVYHLLASAGSLKKLQKESKACLDFAVMMAEYALKYQSELFGQQILEAVCVQSEGYRSRNKMLFDELPNMFDLAMIQAKKPQTQLNTLRQMIFKWIHDGLAKPNGKNVWVKTTVSATIP